MRGGNSISVSTEKLPLWQGLYNWMLQEGLETGDRLPSERMLATQFQASRSSIREAMRQLQALGMVEIRQGSGCYRTDSHLGALLWPLKDQLQSKRLLVEEVVEARVALEVAILRLAVERATPTLLDRLDQYLKFRLDNPPASGPDFRFEELLGEMAGNRFLAMMQQLVHQVWGDLTRQGWRFRGREDTYVEHVKMFRHIRARDFPAAQGIMVEHIRAAIERFDELNEPLA